MLVRRVWPSRPTFDSPFADFDSVRREMLRLLDSVAGDTFGEVGAGVFPPMNITQDNDNFYVRAEVPGVKPNELSISAIRNRLSLAGQREILGAIDRSVSPAPVVRPRESSRSYVCSYPRLLRQP